MHKIGDRVKHIVSGEEGTVLRVEECTNTMRLEGSPETSWVPASAYELVVEPPPVVTSASEPSFIRPQAPDDAPPAATRRSTRPVKS